jgi:hypothetical protein
VDPLRALLAMKQRRVRDWLTAEYLNHLVAVLAPLLLEILPFLSALVHAHVLDSERLHGVGPRASLCTLLALNVATGLTFHVIGDRLVRRTRRAVKLDETLAREMDCILRVVDADPSCTEPFRSFTRCSGTREAVDHQATGRA